MNGLPDLFPGFRDEMVAGDGATIHCRIDGDGPPVLLLHGFPQTHAMWHRVAPELAKRFTVVVADLRGYGASSVPDADRHPDAYSKRAMALDMVAVMRRIGFEHFALVGHDRGARVAYRLALDHPQTLTRLAVLDILPTFEYWQRLDRGFGLRIYHWMFLAQPYPLPERLIGGSPDFYLEQKLASWTMAGDLSPFQAEAMAHYRAQIRDPARLRAMCEDYRAGAAVDYDHDAIDRQAGRKIRVPLLYVWGEAGIAVRAERNVAVWEGWADTVKGQAVRSGHFLPEENPTDTLAALVPFLSA